MNSSLNQIPNGVGYRSDFGKRGENQKLYEPIPDGRFYTKANFFTLKDQHNQSGILNSQNADQFIEGDII